jgi:hypothetical protein
MELIRPEFNGGWKKGMRSGSLPIASRLRSIVTCYVMTPIAKACDPNRKSVTPIAKAARSATHSRTWRSGDALFALDGWGCWHALFTRGLALPVWMLTIDRCLQRIRASERLRPAAPEFFDMTPKGFAKPKRFRLGARMRIRYRPQESLDTTPMATSFRHSH